MHIKLTINNMALAAFIVATFFPLAHNGYNYLHAGDKSRAIAISHSSSPGELNQNYLSHRLINFDKQNHLISETNAAIAYGNTDRFLASVKNNCKPTLKNIDYLSCANKILGNHFYYAPSREVSTGWFAHFSDCDLNVYLLMDAMRLVRKDSEIVYAPGHAFLSYQDETSGETYYWETTNDNNTGSPADLLDEFYIKTITPFYYKSLPESFAEKFYPVLVVADIKDPTKHENILSAIQKDYADNPYAQDVWYDNKPGITKEDVQKIAGLLQTDMTSVTKTNILAQHFIKNNQKESARTLIQRVPDSLCGEDCIKIKRSLILKYKFIGILQDGLKKISISLPLSIISPSLRDTIIFYVVILLSFVLCKLIAALPTPEDTKKEAAAMHPSETSSA